jgi:hypothetical protein
MMIARTIKLVTLAFLLVDASRASNAAALLRREETHEEHRMKNVIDEGVPPAKQDLTNCPQHHPTLHQARNTSDNSEVREDYTTFYGRRHFAYEKNLAPGTLITEKKRSKMLTTLQPDADFVFWGGQERGVLEMSAYDTEMTMVLEGETRNGFSGGVTWRFVSPAERDFGAIKKIVELEGNDYVVFIANNFSVFAHFFLDYLPYIAYLRKTMPSTTRFLLADARKHNTRARLEKLDPEFAKRIDWILCDKPRDCNQLVKVRNGSLTVLRPVSGTRHMNLLLMARQWILQSHPPKPESSTHLTVVYYTRHNASAGHGRAMVLHQERVMIKLIEQALRRYGRPEELVVFDGTQSFDEQINIFQSANFVIGPHGGGLANLIFLLPASTCEERPKVLEFITNSLTPEVQKGSMGKTYYNLYSTCPWAEYHHVLYVPPSSEEVTFVNLHEFKDAINVMFAPPSDDNTETA